MSRDGRSGRAAGSRAACLRAVVLVGVVAAGMALARASTVARAPIRADHARPCCDSGGHHAAPACVRRDGGRVWIQGVPTLGWGKNRECTYAGALEAALAVTEHPCDYEHIMGWSALAFRVRWYQGHTGSRWCPSSPVGEFPEELAATQKATGWTFQIRNLLGQASPEMERFAGDIVASINAGRPVAAYTRSLNMAVLIGYADGGQTVLVQDYSRRGEPYGLPVSDLGPMLILLREHTAPLPRGEALTRALAQAVRNWRRDPAAAEKGRYLYGEAALAAWEADLGKVETLSEAERDFLFFINWWNFSGLSDARRAAVAFLKHESEVLEGDAATVLRRAAVAYGKEVRLLDEVVKRKEAFLGPWTGKCVRGWKADVRRREAEILAEARRLEALAIAELEAALAAREGRALSSAAPSAPVGSRP